MNRKGLVALLDGLQAYAVAFLAIGFATLLLTNTSEADSKTTYALNVWAEDLADAIGWSCLNPSTGSYWSTDYNDASLIPTLQKSLNNIADENNIIIKVEGAGFDLEAGFGDVATIEDIREIAVATRFLVDSAGNLEDFTVKVGIR